MLVLEHWEYIASLGCAFLFGAWVGKMVTQWRVQRLMDKMWRKHSG